MHCICGHSEATHVAGGRCRVPDCPCDHFQPGDTMKTSAPQGSASVTAGAAAFLDLRPR